MPGILIIREKMEPKHIQSKDIHVKYRQRLNLNWHTPAKPGLPKPGRGKQRSSHRGFRESTALPQHMSSDSWPPEL
jgi:hypothetical protein